VINKLCPIPQRLVFIGTYISLSCGLLLFQILNMHWKLNVAKIVRRFFSFGKNRVHLENQVKVLHHSTLEKKKKTYDLLASHDTSHYSDNQLFHHLPEPSIRSPSKIISKANWKVLWKNIPRIFQEFTANLIFSTEHHGFSLNTLYKHCEKVKSPQLILIRTVKNEIIGAYLPESIHRSSNFYGSGSTFMFSLNPTVSIIKWVGNSNGASKRDLNSSQSLFQYGDSKFFAVGGGGLHFGLTIDDSLWVGTSGSCNTFGEGLKNSEKIFNIKAVEVYAFLP
jgi:hypothetical protein